MRRRPRRSARAIALLLALVTLIATAGCGLDANEEPQAIALDDLPEDLLDPNPPTTTTTPDPSALTSVTVYLIKREGDTTLLAPVARRVTDPTRAAERINALLMPTSAEEQREGLISSIATDTVLLRATLISQSRELVVDLSSAIFDVQGQELANAFAQLVWTVTELDGVRQVRFMVDGEALRAPNAEGVEQDGAVTRSDYSALAPDL